MDFDKIAGIISRIISISLVGLIVSFFYLETKGHVYNDGFDLIGRLGMRADKILKEKSSYQPTTLSIPERNWSERVNQMTQDYFLGNPDAHLTVYVFSSFDCPACSRFHITTLPQIEEQYIKTNQVKLVFKNFPLKKTGLSAALLARCLKEEQYYAFVDTLMHKQNQFLYSKNALELLKDYALNFGLTPSEINSCLADEELAAKIIEIKQKAIEKYEINSTPTIIIEDQKGSFHKMIGAQSFKELAKIIDSMQ